MDTIQYFQMKTFNDLKFEAMPESSYAKCILFRLNFSLIPGWLQLLLISICIWSTPSIGFSHPHVFMDTQVDFQFTPNGLKGIWINWLFDEIFSATIKMDFDADRNNQFSDSEVRAIKTNAFANLKNFNYFTSIIKNNKKVPIKSVTLFSARMEKNRLRYRFFIPLEIYATTKQTSIKVSIYDKTFYCDIGFDPHNAIKVKGAEQFRVRHTVQQDFENEILYNNAYQTASRDGITYDGTTYPYEVTLKFIKK